jgi:hypothetical protein
MIYVINNVKYTACPTDHKQGNQDVQPYPGGVADKPVFWDLSLTYFNEIIVVKFPPVTVDIPVLYHFVVPRYPPRSSATVRVLHPVIASFTGWVRVFFKNISNPGSKSHWFWCYM